MAPQSFAQFPAPVLDRLLAFATSSADELASYARVETALARATVLDNWTPMLKDAWVSAAFPRAALGGPRTVWSRVSRAIERLRSIESESVRPALDRIVALALLDSFGCPVRVPAAQGEFDWRGALLEAIGRSAAAFELVATERVIGSFVFASLAPQAKAVLLCHRNRQGLANLDILTMLGDPVIAKAAAAGMSKDIKSSMLLRSKAAMNCDTALHHAASARNPREMLAVWLEGLPASVAAAVLSVRNSSGETPLDLMARRRRVPVAELVAELPADVRAELSKGPAADVAPAAPVALLGGAHLSHGPGASRAPSMFGEIVKTSMKCACDTCAPDATVGKPVGA